MIIYDNLNSLYRQLSLHTFFSDFENMLVIYPADVVLFEGILVFYFPKIRDLFHMKLFVDTDSDTRLARRGKHTQQVLIVLALYIVFITFSSTT